MLPEGVNEAKAKWRRSSISPLVILSHCHHLNAECVPLSLLNDSNTYLLDAFPTNWVFLTHDDIIIIKETGFYRRHRCTDCVFSGTL
jgi:hypothetical protein